jgi:hypothetical protein
MPERIQRKRTKGWRKPEGAVYVGRPSKWGNPYERGRWRYLTGKRVGEFADAADVVRMFESAAKSNAQTLRTIRDELAGRDLMCWCPLDQPCHADVLLKLANAPSLVDVHLPEGA